MKKRVFFVVLSVGILYCTLILYGAGLGSTQPDYIEQGNSYAQVVLLNGTINGSGLAIATGERRTLYQGYTLYVLGIDVVQSRVLIRLLHDNDVVFENWIQAGDSFAYAKQVSVEEGRGVKYDAGNYSENNANNNNISNSRSNNSSSNITILSVHVDSLYEGGTRDLVMLYPIYQYLDTDYESPVIDVLSGPHESNLNKTPLNNNSKNRKESPASGISIVISIMLIVALYIQIKIVAGPK